jgi:hypothetical protein
VAIPKVVEEAVIEEDELLEGEIPDEEALRSEDAATGVEALPEDSDGDGD